jgi:hypothetical protein
MQRLLECGSPDLLARIVSGSRGEHADAPYPLGLLSVHRERPRSRRAAKKRDEIAPSHSITSSATESSVDGTVRPSIGCLTDFPHQ